MGSTFTIRTTPPMATIAPDIRSTSAWTASIVNSLAFLLPSSSLSSSSLGSTCTTSPRTVPNFSRNTRSIPIFIVTVDDAHDPHAPSNIRYTFLFVVDSLLSSIRWTDTFPPSEIRYGRTSLRTLSTFSIVSSSGNSSFVLITLVVVVLMPLLLLLLPPSKGEMMTLFFAVAAPAPAAAPAAVVVTDDWSTKRGRDRVVDDVVEDDTAARAPAIIWR